MKINDLSLNSKVSMRLLLADAVVRKTKGYVSKDFITYTLSDGTSTITGIVWDYDVNSQPLELRKVYDVTGLVGEFGGKKQINNIVLRLSADQSQLEFMPAYIEDACNVWDVVMAHIDAIEHKYLRYVTRELYTSNKQALMTSTSAKAVHHVGTGGNLAHTLEVCNLALACAENFLVASVKTFSVDLIIAGALLHDIGKIRTYEMNGPLIEYTTDGALLDHIILGMQMVDDAAAMFECQNEPYIMLLKHIIASHHGQLEYGSPVLPRCMEAHIISVADALSANIDTLCSANAKAVAEGKDMTDKIYTLGGREHFTQSFVHKALMQVDESVAVDLTPEEHS